MRSGPLSWPAPPDPDVVRLSTSLGIDPVPKGRPRTGRGKTYTPQRTRNFEDACATLMRLAMRGKPLLTGPVGVHVVFRHKALGDGDVDNYVKAVLDSGNEIIWQDDRQVLRVLADREQHAPAPGIDLLVWDMTLEVAERDALRREQRRQSRRRPAGSPPAAR